MSVFCDYARYYDMLYRDKDYAAEADYVLGLVRRLCPSVKSLLDLGCGTGRHAIEFARRGLEVHGVDLSERMIAGAKEHLKNAERGVKGWVRFEVGDVRRLDLGRKSDAVVSLFHVVSYQTTNEDLDAVFRVAAGHLKPGGVFFFDFWYGPAVLTQRPERRVKKLEDGAIEVRREAVPRMEVNENCVVVDYRMIIRHKELGSAEEEGQEVTESHRLRYLFLPEVERLVAGAGMRMAFTHAWMQDRAPDIGTWAACCGAVLSD